MKHIVAVERVTPTAANQSIVTYFDGQRSWCLFPGQTLICQRASCIHAEFTQEQNQLFRKIGSLLVFVLLQTLLPYTDPFSSRLMVSEPPTDVCVAFERGTVGPGQFNSSLPPHITRQAHHSHGYSCISSTRFGNNVRAKSQHHIVHDSSLTAILCKPSNLLP